MRTYTVISPIMNYIYSKILRRKQYKSSIKRMSVDTESLQNSEVADLTRHV